MGRQTNKVQKRQRRDSYNKRRTAAAKVKAKTKTKVK